MPEGTVSGRNFDPWWGLLLAVGALLCNGLFFINPPLRRALPWLSIAMAIAGLFFLGRGLKRAFGERGTYRGQILTIALAVISLLVVGMVAFTEVHARGVPKSAGAPRVGDKAPDFTLTDTSGHSVSLDQLFAPGADGLQPKAVLLIFYRGYW